MPNAAGLKPELSGQYCEDKENADRDDRHADQHRFSEARLSRRYPEAKHDVGRFEHCLEPLDETMPIITLFRLGQDALSNRAKRD